MIIKAVYSVGPRYLKDCDPQHVPTWPLKSLGGSLLWVLPLAKVMQMGIREKAFLVGVLWFCNFPREALFSFRKCENGAV